MKINLLMGVSLISLSFSSYSYADSISIAESNNIPIPLTSTSITDVKSITPCATLTHGMDCAALISNTIDGIPANGTLLVQAYNFTEQHIINSIINAKKRGVTVIVILDKISPSQECEGADPVRNAGIPVYIDYKPKIAHNKVMVINNDTVITGSFNFSTNAEKANAENTNVIVSPNLAQFYASNFHNRLINSTLWDGTHKNPVKACNVTGITTDGE